MLGCPRLQATPGSRIEHGRAKQHQGEQRQDHLPWLPCDWFRDEAHRHRGVLGVGAGTGAGPDAGAALSLAVGSGAGWAAPVWTG